MGATFHSRHALEILAWGGNATRSRLTFVKRTTIAQPEPQDLLWYNRSPLTNVGQLRVLKYHTSKIGADRTHDRLLASSFVVPVQYRTGNPFSR